MVFVAGKRARERTHLERQEAVRNGLSLDPLGGVDEENAALAGRQAAANFVREVDVPGGVHQV